MFLVVALLNSTLPQPIIHAAVERSLPTLIKAASVHIDKKTCYGCHNEGYPLFAFDRAASRGFTIKPEVIDAVLEHTGDFLHNNKDKLEAAKNIGGGSDTVGWAMLTLHHGGQKPNATTEAGVKFFIDFQADRDHWRPTSNRPPTQASQFTSTYLAIRGLQNYATKDQKEAAEKRIATAKTWIDKTAAKDTEDRVFKLFGLKATGSDTTKVAKELLEKQRDDGGWSQLDTAESDPYATGSVLVALHEAGGIATDSSEYRRGIAYLLKTQKADGTWHVTTRSKPIQPYYESGFPYEKDQFISSSASSWATAALVLSLPKKNAN